MFEVRFSFPDYSRKKLEEINDALRAMHVSHVEIKSAQGIESYRKRSVFDSVCSFGRFSREYLFKEMTIMCDNTASTPGIIQIDSYVFNSPMEVIEQELMPIWHDDHPGRVIDNKMCFLQEESYVYLIAHRVNNDNDSLEDYSIEKSAKKADWKVSEMPRKNRTICLGRHFTRDQLRSISFGCVPGNGEKWFCYMNRMMLYVHAKRSGFCIYKIEFSEVDDLHSVTVNLNSNEHQFAGDETELYIVNELLDRLMNTSYLSGDAPSTQMTIDRLEELLQSLDVETQKKQKEKHHIDHVKNMCLPRTVPMPKTYKRQKRLHANRKPSTERVRKE